MSTRSTCRRQWALASDVRFRRHELLLRVDSGRTASAIGALFYREGWFAGDSQVDNTRPLRRSQVIDRRPDRACVATTRDGRAVVYSGEDARFEYIYKFVSRDPIASGGAKANATLLDHGTLYVARFDADDTGCWLPLAQGQGPLTADHGFPDKGP